MVALWVVLSIGLCASAVAQESAEAPVPAISVPIVEARMAAVQESADLDDATKTRITELYTQALEQLRLAEEWRVKANEFQELRAGAPETIRAIQAELAEPPAGLPMPPAPGDPGTEGDLADAEPERTLAELEAELAQAETGMAAAQTELADLEKESAQRAERRRQIPDLQVNARRRLDEIRNQLAASAPDGTPAELVEARRVHDEARREVAEQELRSHEQELLSYDSRGRLLSLRTDRARRRVEQARSAVDAWREYLKHRREREAFAAIHAERWRELRQQLEAVNAPEAIQEIAESLTEDIREIAEQRTAPEGILRKIAAAERLLKDRGQALGNLESQSTTLRKKVEAASSSMVIGTLLRGQRRNLEDVRALEQGVSARQHELSETQIKQISVEELRSELYNIEARVQEALEGHADELPEESVEIIAATLQELYTAKRDMLDAQLHDFEAYFDNLLELDARERRLITLTEEFRNYINERVLWVRSGNAIGPGEWRDVAEGLRWLIDGENIKAFAHAVTSDLYRSPVRILAYLLLILLLISMRWQMRRRIAVNGEAAQKRNCTSIRPTVDVAIYSVLVSAGMPLLIALIGWRSAESLAGTEYTRTIGAALMGTAFLVWSLEFWREVMRPKGLGIAHFEWSETPCRSVARQMFIFETIAAPLFLLSAIFDAQGDTNWQVAPGRLALVLVLLGLVVLGHRFMRYHNGALLDLIERARKRSNLALRRVWYFLAILGPLCLTIAAAAGYYYSAAQVTLQVHATLTSAFCLLVFFQIVVRGTVMTRRKLARKHAKGKLKAMRVSSSDIDTPRPHEEIDLDRIDAQAMRLIRSAFVISLGVCVWFIWADDLPALGVLDNQQLWQVTETVETETLDTQNNIIYGTREDRSWITLRDVAVFLFVLGITFIAVQNLPGILEIVLLQRLSLIAGERYAINSIVGYVIAIIGLTWALNSIGFGWGRLQWLIAAMGLGLGFGLQEIFANLVSGIIILFERPIRVGDTVTVGEISGTVSKIRIRATWITAFNRQELIVPNKEFVTGRLVNWTLSDQVLRLEVPVGIAYGSDVALAKRLMLEVARNHPLVMDDPEPKVYFFGFGDSSLNFELRVHTIDESFLEVKDAMHVGIDEAFRAHGVEIPFPQRDLHVKSIPEGMRVERQITDVTPESLPAKDSGGSPETRA